MKQNYINHIALVLDESDSMRDQSDAVVRVADNQIAYLAQRSKELDQETRVTVYTFNNPGNIRCVVYDKDVLRMPSLRGHYRPSGMTALVDATLKALDDLSKTPELYGDHAFLLYVLTDGAENMSANPAFKLEERIKGLKDNWTVAAFVPNMQGKFEAKKFGFPADNIAVWDVSAKGVTEVGETIKQATDNFMTSRAVGVRGTRNLFNMGEAMAKVSLTDINALDKLHPGQYRVLPVDATGPIAPFVEKNLARAYRQGEAFYALTKPEKIQPQKKIAIFDKKSKYVFTGDNARKVLNLPDYEVKVAPASHADFDIYVQSTSVNRKLIAGTSLLILSV
jgi:hypothetical protein